MVTKTLTVYDYTEVLINTGLLLRRYFYCYVFVAFLLTQNFLSL